MGTPQMGGLDFSNILNGAGSGVGTPAQPVGGGTPAAPPAPADPATTYSSQQQQLQDMGFTDTSANLRALVQTQGNVNAAVERLLSSS